jgi:hypothetical protein
MITDDALGMTADAVINPITKEPLRDRITAQMCHINPETSRIFCNELQPQLPQKSRITISIVLFFAVVTCFAFSIHIYGPSVPAADILNVTSSGIPLLLPIFAILFGILLRKRQTCPDAD